MFEEEIKNLTPYDKYIIMIQDLGNTYYSDAKFFIKARFYVECTNNSYKKYYIDKIDESRNRLKRDYELAMQVRANINQQSLSESESQLFIADNDLLKKIEELLTKMGNFLSEHNVELSV